MSFTYDPLNNLPGPQGPYFRLLMLQPSRDYSEPVHCYLVTHPLRACGKYEALSYVWGDALDRERIWCNETEFLVTRNLHFALQYLRYRNVPRRLWIDAICINQDDISERSQQVAIMHLIYHGARRVAISPGPLDFAHILHDSLPRFAPYMSTADANSTTAEGPPPFVGIREFIALTELMDSPWWRRVWVVQELIVSRDAIVLLGSATLPWSTVIHGILAAAADLPTTIFFYERLRNHRNMPGALALWSAKNEFDNASFVAEPENSFAASKQERIQDWTIQSLGIPLRNSSAPQDNLDELRSEPDHTGDRIYTALHLLTRFKNFRATDPRDKVYGLLGIVNSYLDPLGIMPDYRWTLEKCYIHTATKIIAQTRNLDILNVPAESFTQTRPFPSWVPNWKLSEPPTGESSFSDIASMLVSRFEDKLYSFSASPVRLLANPPSVSQEALQVHGMCSDTIIEITKELQGIRQLAFNLEDLTVRTILKTWWGTFQDNGAALHVLCEWESLAASMTIYPTNERVEHVLCWVLHLGNCGNSFQDTYAQFRRFWNLVSQLAKIIGWFKPFGKPVKIVRIFYRLLLSQILTFYHLRDFAYIFGYKLAKTKKGYLALVPGTARVNDEIALLCGGRTPYVIRREGIYWQFIGETYVHGIMYGEAWRQEEIQKIEII